MSFLIDIAGSGTAYMGDFEIDEGVVRSLLRDQHPDLAELDLRLVDGGWDNQMWRLGDSLAVRLPRTERAPALLRKEHRWLLPAGADARFFDACTDADRSRNQPAETGHRVRAATLPRHRCLRSCTYI
jgi:hypothetical protein